MTLSAALLPAAKRPPALGWLPESGHDELEVARVAAGDVALLHDVSLDALVINILAVAQFQSFCL